MGILKNEQGDMVRDGMGEDDEQDDQGAMVERTATLIIWENVSSLRGDRRIRERERGQLPTPTSCLEGLGTTAWSPLLQMITTLVFHLFTKDRGETGG